jgi:three-Cys-motif partner protein
VVAPKTTIWALDPHTAAKHAILGRYLEAWIPILSHGNFPEIAYVDGFAGPGTYSKGEDGSPIIALKAMLGHAANIKAKCQFHFVELDKARAAALSEGVEALLASFPDRNRVSVDVYDKSFEAAYPEIRKKLSNSGNPPTFAFIDPFGWKLPFKIVADIMKRPSSEVLINFMFEEINRFLSHEDQPGNFDALFGCPDWRACLSLSGSSRNQALRDLYARQITESGNSRYVRYFEMKNSNNATDYYLFFATNKLLGLKKMKYSMWKVDEFGAFSFSDATDPFQTVLFSEPNFAILQRQILEEFSGKSVRVEVLEEFVLEKTAFRETHYKKQVLKMLEEQIPPLITIGTPKVGRRRGDFPPGTTITFA